MALIRATNLEKTYGQGESATHALRGVSFSIEKGAFVALMGPSGSGKSTLLHMIGFLDRPTSGTYHFDDKTIDDFTEPELAHVRNKKMGFVFQAFNLLPRTSILENIKLPLLYSDVPEHEWNERAEKAIAQVGLTHRIRHKPSQISGGEKQRVAIARALVNNPQVIFADEPTGNLDSKSGQMVMRVLQDLHEQSGHTIILITHETYTAEHAGRIIRLRDGVIEHDEQVAHRHRATESFTK